VPGKVQKDSKCYRKASHGSDQHGPTFRVTQGVESCWVWFWIWLSCNALKSTAQVATPGSKAKICEWLAAVVAVAVTECTKRQYGSQRQCPKEGVATWLVLPWLWSFGTALKCIPRVETAKAPTQRVVSVSVSLWPWLPGNAQKNTTGRNSRV